MTVKLQSLFGLILKNLDCLVEKPRLGVVIFKFFVQNAIELANDLVGHKFLSGLQRRTVYFRVHNFSNIVDFQVQAFDILLNQIIHHLELLLKQVLFLISLHIVDKLNRVNLIIQVFLESSQLFV